MDIVELIERLQRREHFFRNAVEGEYDANLLQQARIALIESQEEMAKIAEQWTSSLRPGSDERLSGHREAARDIAAAIRARATPLPDTAE